MWEWAALFFCIHEKNFDPGAEHFYIRQRARSSRGFQRFYVLANGVVARAVGISVGPIEYNDRQDVSRARCKLGQPAQEVGFFPVGGDNHHMLPARSVASRWLVQAWLLVALKVALNRN